MGKPTDLTAECIAGYRDGATSSCPHYWSSESWLAWLAGAALAAAGRPQPTQCHASRGYSVRGKAGAAFAYVATGADLDKRTLS